MQANVITSSAAIRARGPAWEGDLERFLDRVGHLIADMIIMLGSVTLRVPLRHWRPQLVRAFGVADAAANVVKDAPDEHFPSL